MEDLKKYIYSNVISVFWSSFLLLGGGIFVLYYARIGYMPDFDLKSSVAITAAAAVTSVVITAILLSMMILPGAFWGGFWKQIGGKSKVKRYWCECGSEAAFFRLLVWFSLPLVSIYLAILLFSLIGWFSLAFPVVVFLCFWFYLLVWSDFGVWESLKEWSILSLANLVAALLLFLPLSLIYGLSIEKSHYLEFPSWFSAALAAAFIVFTNVAAAAPQENPNPMLKNFALGASALFVVFWVFGKFDRIPVVVMSMYKFGGVEVSELVLDKEGCELSQSLGIDVLSTDYDICIIENVLILSRLGREAYLKIDQGESGILKFTVASSDVVSWTRRDNQKDEN
ncbi:hypothetical protein [Halomonas caseinilytica]|uniref:hypothetical protein n=1 Tax=Halomonas caseinilytica TaxID=438744 RepID=UPI0010BE3674|nr:hypothetical protein [Halomonas caseinilytica]